MYKLESTCAAATLNCINLSHVNIGINKLINSSININNNISPQVWPRVPFSNGSRIYLMRMTICMIADVSKVASLIKQGSSRAEGRDTCVQTRSAAPT